MKFIIRVTQHVAAVNNEYMVNGRAGIGFSGADTDALGIGRADIKVVMIEAEFRHCGSSSRLPTLVCSCDLESDLTSLKAAAKIPITYHRCSNIIAT